MQKTPSSILTDNTNQVALSALQAQEKPMLATAPSSVVAPSSFLQKYIDTGESLFKDAAGHAMSVLQNATAPILASNQTITQDPAEDEIQSTVKQSLSGISHMESDVKGNKYMATRKNSDGSTDLGKYQVNSATLQNLAPKYLGMQVTPAQFLADPNMQERFATDRVTNFARQGYGKDDIASMWHHGASSKLVANDPYVEKFNSFLAEQ